MRNTNNLAFRIYNFELYLILCLQSFFESLIFLIFAKFYSGMNILFRMNFILKIYVQYAK